MEDSLQLNLEILAEQGIALIRCRGQLKFGKECQLLKKCVDSVLSQFSICVLRPVFDLHSACLRPVMKVASAMTAAATSRTWIEPPRV